MTTVIDHAIAIPTRPANVWELVRDISQNPNWQLDSQRVQFLTTAKAGRGTRWRNTSKNGKEQVFEILAWYEGLGYEYRIVDGATFANTRGRIRIQEAPEGTILQWTISYETSGFIGNLRNRLGVKGLFDKEVVQGLRNLYMLIKENKADEAIIPEESKAYLKEAPNVEERAAYQPRHSSNLKSQEIKAVETESSDSRFKPPVTAVSPINEPPLVEDDTRPNPSITPEAPKAPASPEMPTQAPRVPLDEPDFLRHMPEAIQSKADSLPSLDNKLEEETAAAPSSVPLHIETEAASAKNEPVQAAPDMPSEPAKSDSATAKAESLSPERDYSKLDTAQISVFELFGLQKPSETENVRTIADAPSTPPPSPAVEAPKFETIAQLLDSSSTQEKTEAEAKFMNEMPTVADVEPEGQRRRGLRASLRQRLAPVRLPKGD